MKHFIILLCLLSARYVFAQEKADLNAPKQANLTKLQRATAGEAVAQALALDLEYKLKEYHDKLVPIQKQYTSVFEEACAGIGVPKEKLAECQMDPGWVDPKTKEVTGRVAWSPVVSAPNSIGKAEKK